MPDQIEEAKLNAVRLAKALRTAKSPESKLAPETARKRLNSYLRRLLDEQGWDVWKAAVQAIHEYETGQRDT
jgi:ribosomal 50S subunit-associated protein YjgA (DUF615 family)